MANVNKQTSLITILSSDHGRLRRTERDISKRDFRVALKKGTIERTWGGRWKVEHDGIIFILQNDLKTEVTAYPSPLACAPLDFDARSLHTKAKQVIDLKPELCATHTVIVMDNSGSMRTHDISLHRDRHTAAYSTVALEFVAEQLFNATANNSDVVSLIEFNTAATTIFEREPVGWVLYNKLLSRRDTRTFLEREDVKLMELLRCDSNYLPALDAAEKLLAINSHENCALSLLFLSDGAPSDYRQLGIAEKEAQDRICQRVESMAAYFKSQLNILMVGFGNARGDFSVLEKMVEAAQCTAAGASARFLYCDKIANAIGTAITSLVDSTIATRTALVENRIQSGRTKRMISSELETQTFDDWMYYRIANHFVYNPYTDDFQRHPGLPPGSLSPENMEQAASRQRKPPPFLAINKHHCGSGVERVAFRCRLSDGMGKFALGAMVAKETNSVECIQENIAFHKTFLQTQSLASHLAEEFNSRLRALPDYDPKLTPKVTFLDCSVLVLEDSQWDSGYRGVLVEKMLDTETHGWYKWNNNAGAVDGRVAHPPIDVEFELAQLDNEARAQQLDVIAEDDSSEESSTTESDSNIGEMEDMEVERKQSHYLGRDEDMMEVEPHLHSSEAMPSDYLQAFTHFTYRFTNRKVMVCDLQGVFNVHIVPPTFELTDPAIHYSSKRGREMQFGRTDKGRKGMQLFFDTHKCSRVCKLLQLSRKNSRWRKEWQQNHSHKFNKNQGPA